MPNMDLQTALQMFTSGAHDLAFSRALNQANDTVQQVKASEASDSDKRAQLQQVANGLTMQMTAFGAPAASISQLTGSIAPSYTNANDMNLHGLMTGDSGLQDIAEKQQEFEEDPKTQIALIKANNSSDPVKKQQAESLLDNRFTNQISNMSKTLDTQTSRFGNISKLQGVNNQIQDVSTLLDHPEQITRQNIGEVSRKLDSILSGGSATVSGTEHITPDTLKQWGAKSAEFVTSKPQAINIPEFVDFYKNTLSRIKDVNNGIITGAQKNIVSANAPVLYKQFGSDPDRRSAIDNFLSTKVGEGVTQDPTTKKIVYDGVKNNGSPMTSTPQLQPVMVRDKKSGSMIKALKDPTTGQLYSADGS